MNDLGRLVGNYLKKKRGGRIGYADGGAPDAEAAYDPMTGAQLTPTISETAAPDPQGGVSRVLSRLAGTQFGEPRYQTWPEKMVRSGVSLAGDVVSGEQPMLPPGSRREDYTDIPPPSAPDENSTWLGRKLGIAPVAAQPNDPAYERAQDMAGMAGGQTLLTGAREAAPIARRAMVAAADSQATGAPLAALEHAPKFYSSLERAVTEAPIQKATGEQWLGTIANRGVKKEELEHTGTQAFLEQNRDVPLTKDQVATHIGENKVELGEVNKGGIDVEARARELAEEENGPGSWDRIGGGGQQHYYRDARRENNVRYSDYQLPGGENYREKLMTLPVRRNESGDILGHEIGGDNYTSSHWDSPNVLVHRRSNERDVTGAGEDQSFKLRNKVSGNTTKAFPTEEAALEQLKSLPANLRPNLELVPAGQTSKPSLHVEEIQSDWHQAGRQRGYAPDKKAAMAKVLDLIKEASTLSPSDPRYAEIYRDLPALQTKASARAVPDAPFKKNWHELAIKDAIREAAEKGIDRISWTPGEAQAARYDLSKVADKISYARGADGSYSISVRNGRNEVLNKRGLSEKQLEETIGKEPTKKIVDNVGRDVGEPEGAGTLQGLDLKVGGEGMKGFYDKMIPDAMNKIGKPHGVKAQKGSIKVTRSRPTEHASYEDWVKAEQQGIPVHYMDIPPSLKEQALKKGFSLFEDSSTAGAPLAAVEHPVDAASGPRYTSDHAAAAAPAEAGMDVRPGLAGPPGGTEGVRAAELQAQRWAGEHKPLPGLPQGTQIVEGQPFIPGPVAKAHEVAERYMADKDFGRAAPDKYHPIDAEHAKSIAKAFDEMAHEPNAPKVKAAYQALADETLAQYNAIVEHSGLKVTPVNGADYPYHGNPRAVVKDVADNNHMAFFKTDEGFGSSPVELAEHPLLQKSGVKVGDHDMLYNDLFRVVHDYFGHVKNGYGFRGAGEDNAWRAHAAMYSPEARRAMTTETRGQNSWLNYGPHGEFNRTANAADTIYAPQKIGLLPDWVMGDRIAAPAIKRARLADEAGLPIKGKDYTKQSRAALDEIAAGPKGAGPLDLSTQAQIPDVPQVAMDRYVPPRGISPRMQAALENPAVARGIGKSIQAGKELGADKWYHTEPVRRAFVDALGPEEGQRAFSKYMDMVSASSPRSDVATNIRNGSFYYQHALAGKGLPEKLPYPFGHVAQALHRSNYEGLVAPRAGNLSAAAPETTSAWDIYKNPKPASFSQNLQGNLAPATIDTHAFRNIAMRTEDPRFMETSISQKKDPGRNYGEDSLVRRFGEEGKDVITYRPQQLLDKGRLTMKEAKDIPSFWATRPKDNEYAAAEELYRKLGKKAGLPTADAQAAAWSGAGKMTGLASPATHTFPELFNERVLYTAKMRGEDPQQTLRDFIRGNKPLLEDSATAGAPLAALEQQKGDFKKWFGKSKVAAPDGKPLTVYRGEHGEAPEGQFHSKLNSLSFSDDPKAASTYAMDPNDHRDRAVAPRVSPVHLKIEKPIINNTDDPFIDLAHLQKELGVKEAMRIAKKFSNDIEYTGNWDENYSGKYDNVADLLKQKPEELKNLYFDTFKFLDDPAEIEMLKKRGYDGAIHVGNGETSISKEYRVFDPKQVKSAIKGFRRGGAVPRSFAEGGAAGDDYNTAVPDEAAFQAWKAVNAPQDSGVDYDLRGAYLANMQRAENGHMGDQFKKPNHSTFSDQSQYAVGDQRARAGSWQGETFVPPAPRAFGGRTRRRYAEGGDVDTDASGDTTSAMPTFDPARLAAAKPRAPTFDPAKLASTQAKPPGPMGLGDVASEAIGNLPSSAMQFAQDVVRPVMHPVETLEGVKNLGLGLLEKSGAIGTIFPSAGGGHEQYADALGKYLMDRYGGIENAKKSIAKDPVGVLADASMILTGGGSAAARLPGALGKVGEVTANIGRAVDPIMAPVNAAKVGTKAVGELLTHTGAAPLENAYRTGVEGGEAGDVFRRHMRGNAPMVEPVEMAKQGLEGFQAARGRAYREGMGDITSIDRQMDPLDRVLDFGKIDDAVAKTERFHKFGDMDINEPASAVRAKMAEKVGAWREADPATYHTIEGMDALKKSLGKLMMNEAPGTPARAAASEIYNAVRKTIVEYDPKYAKVMQDYEAASGQIRELERAMSLGEKASADTALRKLQSIMRNNVNANYGRRLELGKLLEENGATHLMAALSGQSLNAWAPRGLGKLGAEAVALGAAGHFVSPLTLAAAPMMSPRLMGELAHGTGRTVGRALNATGSALSGIGGNRAAANTSYRTGRATSPEENNPYAP